VACSFVICDEVLACHSLSAYWARALYVMEHLPRPSVCLQSVLWQNGRLDPEAVWGCERGRL